MMTQKLVRTDHEVDLAFGQRRQRLRDLLGRPETRQLGDFHRPVGEAVGERVEVLLGEQRGRHEHDDLLAFVDRHERGTQRDLGLAKADVAADQAVHRFALLQVVQGRFDRRALVGRFLEWERVAERFVIMLLQLECMAFAQRALRIKVQEFGRGVAHLCRGFFLGLVPLAAAQIVERRRFGGRAAVAADQMQLRHWHVELVAARVFERQEFGGAFAEIEILQTQVAADAVLQMNDWVADFDLGEVAQHAFAAGFARLALAARAHLRRIQLVFGDDRDATFVQHESCRERRDA